MEHGMEHQFRRPWRSTAGCADYWEQVRQMMRPVPKAGEFVVWCDALMDQALVANAAVDIRWSPQDLYDFIKSHLLHPEYWEHPAAAAVRQ